MASGNSLTHVAQRPFTLTFCTQEPKLTHLTPALQYLRTPTPGRAKRKQHFPDQWDSEFAPSPKFFSVDNKMESDIMENGYFLDENVCQKSFWTPGSTGSDDELSTADSKHDNDMDTDFPATPGAIPWKVGKRRLTLACTPMTQGTPATPASGSIFNIGTTGFGFDIPIAVHPFLSSHQSEYKTTIQNSDWDDNYQIPPQTPLSSYPSSVPSYQDSGQWDTTDYVNYPQNDADNCDDWKDEDHVPPANVTNYAQTNTVDNWDTW